MSADNLFDLFRDSLKSKEDLVASEPLTLDAVSEFEEEQDLVLEKISRLEDTEIKVDYSDFSNFVFFNSALDYFNITGEKILNEFPFAGSLSEKERFVTDLDGYQRHVLLTWPKFVGHLRLDPTVSSSFVTIEDIGLESGVSKNGILSPSTGSLTIETWYEPAAILTGTDDFQMLVQKMSGSSASERYGYSLFLSGSDVTFMLRSGSIVDSVSTSFVPGEIQYVAAVLDRSSFTGSIAIITGSLSEFPVVAETSSIQVFDSIDISSAKTYIASGTLELPSSSKTNVWFTGSIGSVSIWKKARSINELSSSFNVKQYAQKHLVGLYRFNEPNSAFEQENNRIAVDSSGMGLNGRISGYYDSLRSSGSLLTHEDPDPILNIATSDVSQFIVEQQSSGSMYDRSNGNKMTDMLPENFFVLEEIRGTEILKNFLYVLARHYDLIKLHIDQFMNVLRVSYGDFDQTPDSLLPVVAKFFGWEFTGNFLNADAFQYLLGRGVLKNVESNDELDVKLFEIKNKFWRRLLLNLLHIYKTKGTRESIKSLLRVYGINDNFVKLKEFGHVSDVGIRTNRVHAEKGVNALGFGSGSLTASVSETTSFPTGSFSIETRVRFPTESSNDIQPTVSSGSIWTMTAGTQSLVLRFDKDSISSNTGTLTLSASDGIGSTSLTGAGIFDDAWYNIVVMHDHQSASLSIETRHLDKDEIDKTWKVETSPITSGVAYTGGWDSFRVGGIQAGAVSSVPNEHASEYWMQEARVWDKRLSSTELDDHAKNFQSYGVDDVVSDAGDLLLHWRLREDVSASDAGAISVVDVSTNDVAGSGTGFLVGSNPYKKFLTDYNYIASLNLGWDDEKIRTFDSTSVRSGDFVNDDKMFSLEFNMIDALDEDIAQIRSSLDHMNEAIGFPANRYRVHYDDLEIIRHTYFSRLKGRLNFKAFADMLDFFDRSFIDMIKRLVPARAVFIGDEFVVESHSLERSKVTYERRRNQETTFEPEGRIEIWTRFGRNDDKSGSKYPLLLTGSI